jgi:hypothetical protein
MIAVAVMVVHIGRCLASGVTVVTMLFVTMVIVMAQRGWCR